MTTPQYGSDAPRKLPLQELGQAKRDGRPLVMITAYDYPSGRIAERAGVDMVLVGDSAAMVVLGHSSTVPATMDEMIMLTAAVTRACRRPIVVADLPFMSYQVSDEDALRAAGRFLKEAAADAVKLEGAGPMLARIRALAGAGIPVVAHLGLTPQTATMQGGFRAQGKTAQAALRMLHDAHAAEAAGAIALVLEAVPAPVAERISSELDIPTIGIGAGAGCDGQVLVFHDLLGLGEGPLPRFVEQYASLGDLAVDAVARYADDVRARHGQRGV
jgi:3-methyl-2-oxobutanoate hydroxymethyltransferase